MGTCIGTPALAGLWRAVSAFAPAALLALGSCSAPKPAPEPATLPDKNLGAKSLWHKKLDGFITDLSVSRDGSAILVASAPNREVEGGTKHYWVTRLNAQGGVSWKLKPSAPVKAQAISDDGALAVVATYDDQLTGYDASGRELWVASGTCRPFVLTAIKRVVCYHDDDAEARVAFDVFDFNGKKLRSHAISTDIFAFKVADDQKHLAIALDRGQVLLFGQDFKTIWQKKVPGEVVDLDVSVGAQPRVAVLFNPKPGKEGSRRKIALLDFKGKSLAEAGTEAAPEQIEFSPDGQALYVHGTGAKGQYLGRLGVATATPAKPRKKAKTSLEAEWHRTVPVHPDTSTPMAVVGELVFVGWEAMSLIGVDPEGKTRVSIAVTPKDEIQEATFLYADAITAGFAVVGADDGALAAYDIGIR